MAQEERKFMTEILLKYDFSEEQKKALLLDIQVPQDPFQMFDYMTTIKDRDDFYGLAEGIFAADGFYADEEKSLMEILRERGRKNEESNHYVETRVQENRPRKRGGLLKKLLDIFEGKAA